MMRQCNRIRFVGLLSALLLSGCSLLGEGASMLAEGEETEGAQDGAAEQAMPAQPPLMTKVHLQALYNILGQLEDAAMTHDEMRYLLWLPEGYWENQAEPWPLLIYLHGAGDGEYDSASVISGGLPAVLFLDEQPEDFPFVVLSPQAFPGATWWSDESLPVLNAMIGDALDAYNLDSYRVYLTGMSMGGYGAWFLATAYPERFTAMVSVSGNGYRTSGAPRDEVLCRMADLAVWGVHGAQDRISQPQASKFFLAALKTACKGEAEFTLSENLNHMTTPDRIYRDPALYEWLLAHTRQE